MAEESEHPEYAQPSQKQMQQPGGEEYKKNYMHKWNHCILRKLVDI